MISLLDMKKNIAAAFPGGIDGAPIIFEISKGSGIPCQSLFSLGEAICIQSIGQKTL